MKIPKSGRMMFSIIAIPVIAYGAICLLFYMFQRQMLYYPTPEVNVPGVAHIILDRGKVRIKVWTINTGRQKALIYFGGNAENVAYNIDDFRTLFPDRTVYLVNYRGYGGSSGSPSEKGFQRDALLAYDHFSKYHSAVSVMGRSVGAAVATYLASQRRVEKLVLITPFDSAVSVGRKIYPFLPMGLIVQEKLDAAAMAGKITAATLIVAAADDEIIPYENTRNLAEAFTGVRPEFVSLSGVGHNTVQLHPDYKKQISSFLQ
ncbi:alpha/beta hydrolase [Sulfurimonas sp. HSL3-7]|uniref:alpha/beta hydrolase n=1 Tax=Sulfonitrofixus jiaomeiensis TaxID=3131938 RepID=UPI0031F72F7E